MSTQIEAACYRAKHDYDRAVSDLNETIRIDPGFFMACNNRGSLCQAVGDYVRGVADYDQAIRLHPSHGHQ